MIIPFVNGVSGLKRMKNSLEEIYSTEYSLITIILLFLTEKNTHLNKSP